MDNIDRIEGVTKSSEGVKKLKEHSKEGTQRKTKSVPIPLSESDLKCNFGGPPRRSTRSLMVNTHKRPFYEGKDEVTSKVTKKLCSSLKDPVIQENKMDSSEKNNDARRGISFDLNHPPTNDDASPQPIRRSSRIRQRPEYLRDFHCGNVSSKPTTSLAGEIDEILKENVDLPPIDGVQKDVFNQMEGEKSSSNDVASEIAVEPTADATDGEIDEKVKENEELPPIDAFDKDGAKQIEGERSSSNNVANEISMEPTGGVQDEEKGKENEELPPIEEDTKGEKSSFDDVVANEITMEPTGDVMDEEMDISETKQPSFEKNVDIDMDETDSKFSTIHKNDNAVGGAKLFDFDLNELPDDEED